MKNLLSVEQFVSLCPDGAVLPSDEAGKPCAAKIEAALRGASGIIIARLPWLLAGAEIVEPVPAQFAGAIEAICFDIALFRLTDAVMGSENSRNRYTDNMRLLEAIDKEHKGGLSGPDNQGAFIVMPNTDEGIDDSRYWKKGRVL
jgi:phage gp36-like protein